MARVRWVRRIDLVTCVILLGLVAGVFWFIWPSGDRRDFGVDHLRGRTAEEVIAELGPPSVDSRGVARREAESFWLGYATGDGRYRVVFEDGRVVGVDASTR